MTTPPRGRILVIDDDPAIGRAVARLLRLEHDCTCLTDSTEALARLVAGEMFDVIVSDLMMPQMSGPKFFEAVAARWPEVAARIVFVTGGALTEEARRLLHVTQNTVLMKPVEGHTLRRVVADHVCRRGEPDPPARE